MEWIRPRQAQQASRSCRLRPGAFKCLHCHFPSLCHYPHSRDWLWSIRFWTVCPSPQLCVRWLLHLLQHCSLTTSTNFTVSFSVFAPRVRKSPGWNRRSSPPQQGVENMTHVTGTAWNSSRHATHDPARRPSPSWFGCTAECTGGVFAWQPGENCWTQDSRCLSHREASLRAPVAL